MWVKIRSKNRLISACKYLVPFFRGISHDFLMLNAIAKKEKSISSRPLKIFYLLIFKELIYK